MNDWVVLEFEDGKRLRLRRFLESHSQSGAYKFRVEFFFNRTGENSEINIINDVETKLQSAMESDMTALLAAITEEDSQFVYTWYTKNIDEFGARLNSVLSSFPVLPISLFSMDDPEWEAYKKMNKYLDF